MQTNMPIVLGSEPSPYGDTPTPKVFGTVSPLDPQIFSTVVEYTQGVLAGQPGAKYSPIEVAQWLEEFAATASEALSAARRTAKSHTSPDFRRIEEDVLIEIGVGSFFAAKLRSAVLYEIFVQTGNAEAGKLALAQYKKAREAWVAMATRANGVYISNVSYGDVPKRKGHWSDRIPGIDTDLAAMAAKLQSPPAPAGSTQNAAQAIRSATGKPMRPVVECVHTAPLSFHPGQPLSLSVSVASGSKSKPASARLFYRHVDQAERWLSTPMQKSGSTYTAAIPADYTGSIYPLQYYFELQTENAACFFPAFNATLSNQPYYAVSKRNA
jgi:hypothetical protein